VDLTPTQRATLKTAIQAEPSLATALAQGNDVAVAAWCNTPSPFVVWRTRVEVDEIMSNGFVWTEVDNLTAGKARIWQWMSQLGAINPSKQNVRQGLRDCFEAAAPGTYGDRVAGTGGLQPHLRRAATNAERVLATGTGTIAQPGLMTVEGTVSLCDVSQILRG
jgi:hypothetical protein